MSDLHIAAYCGSLEYFSTLIKDNKDIKNNYFLYNKKVLPITYNDNKLNNPPTNTNYWQPDNISAYLLRSKIVGQINQIKISPTNRGLLYHPGDPVIVYNGLSSNTGIGATAIVGDTTKGSIQRINVINGGFGYTAKPNTMETYKFKIGKKTLELMAISIDYAYRYAYETKARLNWTGKVTLIN